MHASPVPQAARVALALGVFNVFVMAFVANAVLTAPAHGEALSASSASQNAEETSWACPGAKDLQEDLAPAVVMREGCVPVVQF